MKKRLVVFTIIIIIGLFVVETFLRIYLGFCDTVLMREDAGYEYIAMENQKRNRFQNFIKYNSYSMRSDELCKNATIILGFGDSVINGGVMTDHDSLATTLLSDTLSSVLKRKVQFLNVSAGSWGPDNCYAYLKKHGDFNAVCIFLIVSSHDAYDNMDYNKIIGVNKSFPNEQYSLALYELFDRYLLPKLLKVKSDKENGADLGINKRTVESEFNTGFGAFLNYSNITGIPIIVYLHATRNELNNGSYNKQGKEIIEYCLKNNIYIIKDIEQGILDNDYRDNIHLNEGGQQAMAKIILKEIFLQNKLMDLLNK